MTNPVITIVTTLPPTSSTTPVVITVAGTQGVGLRLAWISMTFPGVVGDEVVYNGTRFGAFYVNGVNTRTSITNGYQFTVLRDGGWPVGAFPFSGSFTINAVDTLGNGDSPRSMYVFIGNSNFTSQGVTTDNAARQDAVLTPSSKALLDKIYGVSVNEPIPLTDMGRGQLRVANTGATLPGFGPELSFGPEIFALLNGFGSASTEANKPWLVSFAISGVRLLDMLKASTYGTATPSFGGLNAYTAFVNRVKAARNDSGREIGALISDLGPNDGSIIGNANQIAARWVQMWSDLQSDLGIGFPLILMQANPNLDPAFNTSTVRTQLALAAASISGCRLIFPDRLSLNSDNIHYPARRIITFGGMVASAVRDVRGMNPRTTTIVANRGYGQPEFNSTGAASAFIPFPHPLTQDGDVQLLMVGTMKNSGSYTAIPMPTVPASGWAQVGNSTQVVTTQTQGFALFSRYTVQADLDANNHLPPDAAILLSNDENYCKLFTLFGPIRLPALRNFTSFNTAAYTNAPISVPSINTTRPNALVVIAFITQGGGLSLDEHWMASNVNLANLTVVSDEPYGIVTGNFGILVFITGTKVTPGAVGITTLTQSTALNTIPCGFIGAVEDV